MDHPVYHKNLYNMKIEGAPCIHTYTQRKIIGNIDHAKLLTANKANIVDPKKSFSN